MLFLVLGDHSHDVLHVLLAAEEDRTPLMELPGDKVENGLPGKIFRLNSQKRTEWKES